MSLVLHNCTPAYFTEEGGGLFVVDGDFPSGQYVTASLVSGGTSLPIYSGLAAQGNQLAPIGHLLQATWPKPPTGAPQIWTLRITCAATSESADYGIPILLLTPFFSSQTYALRSMFAPMWATGTRDITQEPYPWQTM